MRVTKWVQLSREISYDITIQDMVDELNAGVPDTLPEMFRGLSNAVKYLQLIPLTLTESMNQQQREIVVRELRVVLEKFEGKL